MGAWGIVGIVLGALALLCVALCLIPGRLLLLYDAQEGFRLRGSVLFFTFGGGKPKPKKSPKKEEAKKEAPKSAEQHGSVSFKTLIDHAEELAALLGKDYAARFDEFDLVQFAHVVAICRASASAADAAKRLFAVSRKAKKSSIDWDRLSKYLARFGLKFKDLLAK